MRSDRQGGVAALGLLVGGGVGSAKTTTIPYTTWIADMAQEKVVIDKFTQQNPDVKVKMLSIPGALPCTSRRSWSR